MGGMSKSTARALGALGPQLFAVDGDILSPMCVYTYIHAWYAEEGEQARPKISCRCCQGH